MVVACGVSVLQKGAVAQNSLLPFCLPRPLSVLPGPSQPLGLQEVVGLLARRRLHWLPGLPNPTASAWKHSSRKIAAASCSDLFGEKEQCT